MFSLANPYLICVPSSWMNSRTFWQNILVVNSLMMYFLLTATESFSTDSGGFFLTKSFWKLINMGLS